MPNYLLPCSCGRDVSVSVSMAGQTVRCECGTELEVPTLRGLRQLAPAVESHGRRARSWSDRQRVTFVLLVVGLAAGAVAGYMALNLPPRPEAQQIEEAQPIDGATPAGQVYSKFNELEQGIRPSVNVISPEGKQALEKRGLMNWGIRIALILAGGALVAAAANMLVSRRPKR